MTQTNDPDHLNRPVTAFAGMTRIAHGPVLDVALALSLQNAETAQPVLVFDDATGQVIDLDLRGDAWDIGARLAEHPAIAAPPATAQRGRPKLGVVAREVTLLPRHWDWLAAQPGGASAALRRLVDQARSAEKSKGIDRAAQDSAYRFLSALAGDLPGYEEAIRALFAGDPAAFAQRMEDWPQDVQDYARALAVQRSDQDG